MSVKRVGRPPRVHELNGTLSTSVKGQEYRFRVDARGVLRPVNPTNGEAEDRQYAKAQVQRYLTEAE